MDLTALNALTLDQLRLLVAVADEGSFSAAGRSLHRAQSAVSYGIHNLEELVGAPLFVRTGRRPALTEAGKVVLHEARKVLAQLGQLQERTAGITERFEADVSLVVDGMFPTKLLITLSKGFQSRFPSIPLRIRTDVVQGVAEWVLDGTCQIAIAGPVQAKPGQLHRRHLGQLKMVPVAAASHALSAIDGEISTHHLRECVQVVISERVDRGNSVDHGVLSEINWHVADVYTKLAFIRAGLGWGNLPLGLVHNDLRDGALKRLSLEANGPHPFMIQFCTLYRPESPPGIAGQWLLDEVHKLCADPEALSCPKISP